MAKSASDLINNRWSATLDWLKSELSPIELQAICRAMDAQFSVERHGDLPGWLDALEKLPQTPPCLNDFGARVAFGQADEIEPEAFELLRACFESLIPWRKGPFELFGLHLDTEWRSDMKWDRIAPHLDLRGKAVLDIGCGNGYHLWRMLGAGAQRLVGIDPSPRFVVQFYMLKQYYGGNVPIDVLPLRSEDMPACALFDTVFSMGVLYHRKSPLDHLEEARQLLVPGGDLILETLTVEGDENTLLLPQDRYAMMRNVWFIPSEPMLVTMLERSGFTDIRILDTSETGVNEQRRTDWMRFHSLAEFLDPDDMTKTREGYPRPRRTAIMAKSTRR